MTFAQQFEDFDYSIRGGDILNFEIDSETASLIISLDARARGELIITLPRYLIDAKIGSEDTDFDVFIRGMKLASYDETITPMIELLLSLSKDQTMNYLLWEHMFFHNLLLCKILRHNQ